MTKDDFTISSLGISQSERWLETLMPEYVQIDSRKLPDLLKFVAEFAPQINYYNTNNTLDGTWEDFLTSDPYLLALLVSNISVSNNINAFNRYFTALKSSTTAEKRIENLKKLFSYLLNKGNEFRLIRQNFTQSHIFLQLKEIQMNLHDIDDEMRDLHQFFEEASEVFGFILENGHQYSSSTTAKKQINKSNTFFKGSTDKERLLHSLTSLVEISNNINLKFNQLVEAAKVYVKQNKLVDQKFSPQIGLFIAFLDLYAHLQNKINGFNRRHLDFYYKDQLSIQQSKGCPDQVHLIIEPKQAVGKLHISPTELLLAEIKGKDQPIIYQLKSDYWITKAKIAEIKTLLVSQFVQIVSNKLYFSDVVENQVYQSSHALFTPRAYLKNPITSSSWASLGEDQHELAFSMRTMDESDLGLIIGSPLFYLTEGERTIKLKIQFKTESFIPLINYVKNYSGIVNENIENSVHHLLSNAFCLTYTSIEGWQKVKNYSVKCDIKNEREKVLEIIIQLSPLDPTFDTYCKDIHLLSFDSAVPMLRIGLNNYAEHNPFSFFRNTLIERITINSDVKGFKSLMLQNNIGVLSSTNPFQAFGPLPNIGSFLDIKNSNLFNYFTKDFSLNIEWMNLPRNKGGFEAYYKGFGCPFLNESFAVGLSALNGGSCTVEPDRQQKKKLFVTQKNHCLDSRINICDIDFSKIEFLNKPALAVELGSDTTNRDGTLRLELISPPEAFGHQLFPQIFPEAIQKNAKKFGPKVMLPNQPIIPIMKSISVDYILEYSVNFNEGGAEDDNIELYHCYPFGYEKISPGNEKKNIFFMPRFDDECNLLIGLNDLEPGIEFSLLFQLEDNSSHHTLYEPDAIKWTYLENNTWVNFRKKEIVSDSTNNLINSGIVVLCSPKQLPIGNTILNPDLFWVKASSGVNNRLRPYIKGIHTNGVSAIRISELESRNETDLCLLPDTIKGFVHNISGVEQVWQPFPSFNGKPSESPDKYYVRVSERLRHKQRPVQTRDIIQVILEEFPQILMVKCFNPIAENFIMVPGINLQLVLIPKGIENEGLSDKLPQVSQTTLYKVKTFLTEIISPFVKVEVGNPIYEKVKIVCKVKLSIKASANSGFFLHKLNTEINQYVAPWMFGEKQDVKIGNRIYKSDILQFIKTRPYIDYVSAFSVVHFFKSKNILTNELNAQITDSAIDEIEYITCSSPMSIFIPSTDHIITLLDTPSLEQANASGIGDFIIGEEFLISDIDTEITPASSIDSAENDADDERFSIIITHNI